jgi:hypothetical protein
LRLPPEDMESAMPLSESASDTLSRHIATLGALHVPARELTNDEAWSLAQMYVDNSTLTEAIIPDAPGRKGTLKSNQIFGVPFFEVKRFNNDGIITASNATPIGTIDLRLVVFLIRLVKQLKQKWGATKIYHLGFITGNADAHGDGRAFDFVGIAGQHEGKVYEINVFSHWKRQPVELPNGFKTLKKGTMLSDWPLELAYTDTVYRLDPANNSSLDPNKSGYKNGAFELDLAFKVFGDVYDFAARQGQDKGTNRDAPTTIGRDSAAIIHPDYPLISNPKSQKNGRDDHFQHIHIQIGDRSNPKVEVRK